MDNFDFYSPTEFIFGRDTENRCGECVARHGGSRVLIVYGGGSAVRSGLPAEELLCDLADLFKLFGDTTRMRILFSLFES